MNIKARWRKPLLLVFLFVVGAIGVSAALFLERTQSNNKEYVLSLSISPTTISRANFLGSGDFETTVHFTNNSKNNLEFITNGSGPFQFLDIAVVDENGKNYATQFFGDAYKITPQADKKVVVGPGETSGGTVSLYIVVGGQIEPGTYDVQAILRYQNLDVSSNVVRLVIQP